jgi:hypothetical protein
MGEEAKSPPLTASVTLEVDVAMTPAKEPTMLPEKNGEDGSNHEKREGGRRGRISTLGMFLRTHLGRATSRGCGDGTGEGNNNVAGEKRGGQIQS